MHHALAICTRARTCGRRRELKERVDLLNFLFVTALKAFKSGIQFQVTRSVQNGTEMVPEGPEPKTFTLSTVYQ